MGRSGDVNVAPGMAVSRRPNAHGTTLGNLTGVGVVAGFDSPAALSLRGATTDEEGRSG